MPDATPPLILIGSMPLERSFGIKTPPKVEAEFVEVRRVASEFHEDGTSSARVTGVDLKLPVQ